MRIRSRGIFMTTAFVSFFMFTCFLWYSIFSGLMKIRVNIDSMFFIVFIILFSYMTYRAYRLVRAQNYALELRDKDMIYSFFSSKFYKYSDIRKMYWFTLRGWRIETMDIIKLEFRNGKNLIFRIDKLDTSDRDFLIITLRSKVRRDFHCRDKAYYY